ncbi:MAG: hypothetical protein U0U46_08925 [Saprospiraceae bacterium]
MKKQKDTPAPEVDQYLNFGSDHDNGHAWAVWLEAIKTGVFSDPATPLKMFVELRNGLMKVAEHPAKVIPLFGQYTGGMNDAEKLFIARHLLQYFQHTVFTDAESGEPEAYLTGITKPLKAFVEKLGRETGQTKDDLKTTDLRQMLKDVFRREMERLPEYLQSLETKERLNILCKMMPYVLPKVEAVHATEGEPFQLL